MIPDPHPAPAESRRGRADGAEAVVDETTGAVVAKRLRSADTFLKRLIGLLGSRGMAEGEAMWITPCRGIHTMGMQFPIDAIFLDDRMRVVALREDVPPWRITGFIRKAVSVLELPVGGIRRARVEVGHRMGFLPGGAVRPNPPGRSPERGKK